MKHKLFFKVFTLLFFVSISSKLLPRECIDLAKGDGLIPMLLSMAPAGTIIKDGQDTLIKDDGSYHLTENIEGTITIETNNVLLNLNGYRITGTITVSEGSNGNITIMNGSVEGDGTGTGILVEKSNSKVFVKDMVVFNKAAGVRFFGDSGDGEQIECCKLENVMTTSCDFGFLFVYVNKSIVKKCEACCSRTSGFALTFCTYNKFENCKAVGVGPGVAEGFAVAGFSSLAGLDNLFYECMTERVYDEECDWCDKAYGFRFGFDGVNPEKESKIVNCTVDSMTTSSWGNAFGISLDVMLLAAAEQVGTADFNLPASDLGSVTSVSWSPQGAYIAVAIPGEGEESYVKVYQFNGSTWGEIYTISLGASSAPAVEFSPNGQLLAVTYDGILKIYRVSDFAELATLSGDFAYSKWFHCGRMLAVARSTNPDLAILLFEDGELITTKNVSIPGVNGGYALDISPDDKYIIFAERANPINLHIIEVAFWRVVAVVPNVGAIAEFNPTVCCGKYYFAVNNGRFYEFDSANNTALLLPVGMTNVGTPIWFPNGKYVVYKTFADGRYQVFVDEFNPQVDPSPPLRLSFDISDCIIDVSPCGRYVFAACKVDGEPDVLRTEVIRIGDCVINCVVQNNRVANVKGGICGLGIFGASCCNLIDRNYAYGCGVNFHENVHLKSLGGLLEFPGLLDNISGDDCFRLCCSCTAVADPCLLEEEEEEEGEVEI